MKIGTKSVLFGAHQFLIHPLFVALAWWKLYGFPLDTRLWVAFFVHDLGYWGKPNMDGEEGERHPIWAALKMSQWFDNWHDESERWVPMDGPFAPWFGPWGQFVLLHSRYMAKRLALPYSRLCVADKLAVCLEPWWLYLPRAWATGELNEYMERAKVRSARNENLSTYEHQEVNAPDARRWFAGVCSYLRRWVDEHKDCKEDQWTPETKDSRV